MDSITQRTARLKQRLEIEKSRIAVRDKARREATSSRLTRPENEPINCHLCWTITDRKRQMRRTGSDEFLGYLCRPCATVLKHFKFEPIEMRRWAKTVLDKLG